jgi:hypothetical protein
MIGNPLFRPSLAGEPKMNLYIDNDTLAELYDLRDEVTGALITDATVTVTLFDGSGEEVLGAVWPVTMPHVENGIYRAVIPAGLDLDRGRRYQAVMSTSGASWELELTAQAQKVY